MKQNKNKKTNWLIKIFGGLFVGGINGFFGGGGGMIAVPLMVYIMGLENKKAHASAILVILPLSIISSIVYISNRQIEWNILLYVSAGVLLGGVAGAILLNKIKNNAIALIFALLMVAAGAGMLF